MSIWSSNATPGYISGKKIWNDTRTPMFNAGLFTVDKTWKQPKGLSTGEGNGNLPQYSCLENSTDRGAWWAMVHGITKSWTWLSTQHKGLSTDKWIQKMFYIYIYTHTMEYYSAVKKNDEIMPFGATRIDLETTAKWCKSDRER